MDSAMTPERLNEIIALFPNHRVGVIGDFYLDKYLEVDSTLSEHSLETGKLAHQVTGIRCSPGAAGNVIHNLSSLCAGTLYATGFTGDDGESYDLREKLKELRCNTENLFKIKNRMTPTYLKPLDIHITGLEGEHERYDIKNRSKTSPEIEKNIIESLDAILPELDALIIVDQIEQQPDCGVITSKIRTALSERALDFPDVVFFADSRSHIMLFRNVIIKPNQSELLGIKNLSDNVEIDTEQLRNAIISHRVTTHAPIFVTLGKQGIMVSDPEPSMVREVNVSGPIDPTGAGDSATAGIVLALLSGASPSEAALIGNLAASITIQQLSACGTCKPEELLPRLELWLSQG